MPTYDYICNKCEHEFEHFQSMNSEPLKVCPECGGDLKRLIGTGAGAIFKGSGFYQTDYKNVGSSNKKEEPKSELKEKAPAKTEPTPKKAEEK